MGPVTYDPIKQISVVDADGIMVPVAKHSTGSTTTNTNREDARPPDSDTDATED